MQARVPFTGWPEEEEEKEESLFLLRFHVARALEGAQRLEVCGLSPPAVCVLPM